MQGTGSLFSFFLSFFCPYAHSASMQMQLTNPASSSSSITAAAIATTTTQECGTEENERGAQNEAVSNRRECKPSNSKPPSLFLSLSLSSSSQSTFLPHHEGMGRLNDGGEVSWLGAMWHCLLLLCVCFVSFRLFDHSEQHLSPLERISHSFLRQNPFPKHAIVPSKETDSE